MLGICVTVMDDRCVVCLKHDALKTFVDTGSCKDAEMHEKFKQELALQ